MANTYLIDAAKDAALNYLDTAVTQLFITSALCATYAEASNPYKLGVKASPSVSAATDDGTTGRKARVKAMLQKMWQEYQNEPKLFDASQIRAKLERLQTLLKKMVV